MKDKCEPLINKSLNTVGSNFPLDKLPRMFYYDDVKSAMEWMIEQHEEKIEELIQFVKENIPSKEWASWELFLTDIEREYESIMIIESGLEDVIE